MLKDRRKNQTISGHPGKATVVAGDAEVNGDIRLSGALQVDGRVIGNIDANEGVVSVTRDGYVEGVIRAPKVIVDGVIVGDVYASEHLQLDTQARVDGDLYYRFMETVSGAQINGRLHYMAEGQTVGATSGLVSEQGIQE